MKKIKNNIYYFLKKSGNDIDYEIYEYGFLTIYYHLIFFLVMIPIVVCFHSIVETLCFICFFSALRVKLGGFHFDSHLLCLLFSVIITSLSHFINILLYDIGIYWKVSFFIFLIILTNIIGVIDNKNKRLSQKEKNILKKQGICFELFYMLLYILLYYFIDINGVYIETLLSSTIISVSSIVVGKIQEN